MAAETPPALPPDTSLYGDEHPPDIEPDPYGTGYDEDLESIGTNLTLKQDKQRNPEKYMQIHPVYFEVVNDGNATRFLSEALLNLQLVDSTAQILPHGDMPEETETFNNINQIPNDASVSNFTHAYLSGLRVTSSSMKGKFWLRCLKNFPQFNKTNHPRQDGNARH